MEWLLRRNFWIVKVFALVMMTSALAELAVYGAMVWLRNGLASIEPAPDLEEDEEDADEAAAVASKRPRRDPEAIAARILGRNPFCPTCTPAAVDAAGNTPTGTPGVDPAVARTSNLALRVHAIMEAEPASASLATIARVDGGIVGLYAVGEPILADVTIEAIDRRGVVVRNSGVLETLPLGPPTAPPAPKADPAKRPQAAPKKNAAPEGAQEAIACQGESCTVERDFVENLIANPKLLMGQGAARPAKTKAGDPGFRIASVKKGSLPDLLGLANGDIITEVGGTPLTLDALAGLYGKLRHANHIEVTIERDGKRLTRALEIS
jgi:general secretion pathway protein C